MEYRATIRDDCIARARVITVGNDMSTAKRKASAEFRGERIDYTIVIIGEQTPDNPTGVVASKKIGARSWITNCCDV